MDPPSWGGRSAARSPHLNVQAGVGSLGLGSPAAAYTVAAMTTSQRARRASRALVPLTVVGAFGVVLAPVAALADTPAPVLPTATYAGVGVGYDGVINGKPAGTVKLTVDQGETVEAFCVQFNAPLNKTAGYTAKQSWAAAGVANLGKAADIAAHHASLGAPLSNAQAENTAAQLAIWKYTDALDISKVPNAQIVTRANQLVADAQAAVERPAALVVSPSSAVALDAANASVETLSVKVTTPAGEPVSGQTVVFTVGAQSQTAQTGSDGVAKVTTSAPAADQTGTVTVKSVLPAGSVLAPASGQALITTADAPVSQQGVVTVKKALPVPSKSVQNQPPSTIPTPTKAVTPPPAAPAAPKSHAPVVHAAQTPQTPKQLPYTGGWASPWMVVAALAAAGGAFFARKRFFGTRSH